MPTRFYCTYFDQNYIAKGLAMIQSLCQHNPSVEIYVVCMDEETYDILGQLGMAELKLLRLSDIEDGDEQLVEPKRQRSLVEYYWTLTPTIILRVLERHDHIDVLSYVDADLFFYGPTEPIFEEMADRSVLIHEHRFPPRLAPLVENGIYNVGWLSFRDDERGREVLQWWRERCIEWCFKRIEDGKMGDQLYLNDWPSRFEGVHVLQHIGAGLGPWNHEQYAYAQSEDGAVTVSGREVIFYHFHSLAVVTSDLIVPCTGLLYILTKPIIELLVLPYANALQASIHVIRELRNDFSAGINVSGQLASHLVFVARKRIADALRSAPQPRHDLSATWDLYAGPQLVHSTQVQVAPPPGASPCQPSQPSPSPDPAPPGEDGHDALVALREAGLHSRGEPLRLRLSYHQDRQPGCITVHDRPNETVESECSSEIATLHFPPACIDELWVDGLLDVLPLPLTVSYLSRWRRWLKSDGCLTIHVIDASAAVERLARSETPEALRDANRQLLGDADRPRTALWTPETLGALLGALGLPVVSVETTDDATLVVKAAPSGRAPNAREVAQLAESLV